MSLIRGGWRPLAAWTFGAVAIGLVVFTGLAPVFGLPAPDVVGMLTAFGAFVTMYIQRGLEKVFGAERPHPASAPEAPAGTVPPPPAAEPAAPSEPVVPPEPPPPPPPVQPLPKLEPPDLPARRDIRGRSTDLDELHPEFRARLERVLLRLAEEGLPFAVFEGYRSPTRQAELYAQGRTKPGRVVTNARPGQSLHQFGLAADVVLREGGVWSWDTSGERRAWWNRLHAIAREEGLEPLSFEMPHLQLAGWTWQRAAAEAKSPAG